MEKIRTKKAIYCNVDEFIARLIEALYSKFFKVSITWTAPYISRSLALFASILNKSVNDGFGTISQLPLSSRLLNVWNHPSSSVVSLCLSFSSRFIRLLDHFFISYYCPLSFIKRISSSPFFNSPFLSSHSPLRKVILFIPFFSGLQFDQVAHG